MEFLSDLKSKTKCSQNFEYYPCILIIDEILDPIPWEMILPSQEYTRIPSIYVFFDLCDKFKHKFKHKISDGYLELNVKIGFTLINRNKDEKLEDMCQRMSNYSNDNLPNWKCIEKETNI